MFTGRQPVWNPGNRIAQGLPQSGLALLRRRSLGVLSRVALLMALLSSGAWATEAAREPAVAGAFYPGEREELARTVRSLLDNVAAQHIEGELVGLVCPHAGYVYSGPVAAYAYKQLEGKRRDTVVLVGSSHHMSFRGASVGDYAAYKTPLGEMPVDTELARALIGSSELIQFVPAAHKREHSLEVQVPFLQTVARDSRILPIIIGDLSLRTCKEVALRLSECTKGKSVIVIASTDLSHYHPYETARKLDQATVEAILSGDAERLYHGACDRRYQLCGASAVVATMLTLALAGPVQPELLKCANSGDTAGSRDKVVGYAAIAFVRRGEGPPATNPAAREAPLDEEEGRVLLTLARKSIASFFQTGRALEVDPAEHPGLERKCGVFVTLHKGTELRGCIGCHWSDECLCRTVAEMAVASAFRDRRFPPLRREELDEVHIEISVYLSPPTWIDVPEEYEPGKHGIVMRRGVRSATFLPSVPVEQHWDRKMTLRALCRKAGLPLNAWQEEDAEFFVYTTQVFKERETHE